MALASRASRPLCASSRWASARYTSSSQLALATSGGTDIQPFLYTLPRAFWLYVSVLYIHFCLSTFSVLCKPYPNTWPMYIERDWIEQYARPARLDVVHDRSEPFIQPVAQAVGDQCAAQQRNSVPYLVRPQYLVIATSTMGDPIIPIYPRHR